MPSSFPSIPRRPARTSESSDFLVSTPRPESAPTGTSSPTDTPPPEPSLREFYRTYRHQKQLADRYRSQHTTPLSARILSTVKTTWKETSKTAKKLSPVPILREQLETYQSKRDQSRREAMKKKISGPVQQQQQGESDFDTDTAREYFENEQAVARFAENSSSGGGVGGAERAERVVQPPTVGIAVTTTNIGLGIVGGGGILPPPSMSSSSLATRRGVSSFSQNDRGISTINAITNSGESRRTVFTEHLDDDYNYSREDHPNDNNESQQQQEQRPDISSPMSFVCAGVDVGVTEMIELPGSSLTLPATTTAPSVLPTTTPFSSPLSIANRCIHCHDLTGYEETGLCEICSAVYLATVPNPNRIPATETSSSVSTSTRLTRASNTAATIASESSSVRDRDSLIPSPLFSQRGSSLLSTTTDIGINNHGNSGRRGAVSPINIRSIFPDNSRPRPFQVPVLSSSASSPRFDPQFSSPTSSELRGSGSVSGSRSGSSFAASPPSYTSYTSRGFSAFGNFSGVVPRRRTQSLDFSSTLSPIGSSIGSSIRSPIHSPVRSPIRSSVNGGEGRGIILPSYRDTLTMSPLPLSSSVDSPGTPLPEYSPPRAAPGTGMGGRGRGSSSPSSIQGVFDFPLLSSSSGDDTTVGRGLRRPGSTIATGGGGNTRRRSTGTSIITDGITGIGGGSGTNRQRNRNRRIRFAPPPPPPVGVLIGGEEEQQEQEELRQRRDEMNRSRRRGQAWRAVSGYWSSVVERAGRRFL